MTDQLINSKFLVVKGNEHNLAVTSDILKGVGAEVVLATSGKKALDELTKSKFDFILLNSELPDMHGLDILRSIRTSKSKDIRFVQVIIVTARSYAEQKDIIFFAGGNDCIAKPFRTEALYQKIIKLQTGVKLMGKKKIDLKNLEESISADKNLRADIIKTFIQQTSEAFYSMHSACNKVDYETIATLVHKIKPSAHYINIPKLLHSLKNIEDSCRPPVNGDTLKENLDTAEAIFRASIGALSSELYRFHTLNEKNSL